MTTLNFDIESIDIIVKKASQDFFHFRCHARAGDGFVYFLQGEGTLTDGAGEVYPVKGGSLFFFRTGEEYEFRVQAGCEYIVSSYRLNGAANAALEKLARTYQREGGDGTAIERLLREWQTKREGSYMRTRLAILSLYLDCLTASDRESTADPAVRRAVDFIHKSFKRPFTGAEVAAAAAVSPSHLRARFRAVTGMSITEYRDSLRIQAATEMLESGLFSPKEVAYDLGYSDVYYFSKTFRARVGIPPARYAKVRQGKAECARPMPRKKH